jgi:hypothetical protein
LKAYKIELLVIDNEGIGIQEISGLIGDCKYVYPKIQRIVERDIGEWYDDHPLNKKDTCDAEYERLFRGDTN